MKTEELPQLITGAWYMISRDYQALGHKRLEEFPVRLCQGETPGLFPFHYFNWPTMSVYLHKARVCDLNSCRLMSNEEVAKYQLDTAQAARTKVLADINSELRSLFGPPVGEVKNSA